MTDDPQTNDVTTVVCIDANEGNDNDPVAQIDGKTTFLRFGPEQTPTFGGVYRVRIADVTENHMVAVVLERTDDD